MDPNTVHLTTAQEEAFNDLFIPFQDPKAEVPLNADSLYQLINKAGGHISHYEVERLHEMIAATGIKVADYSRFALSLSGVVNQVDLSAYHRETFERLEPDSNGTISTKALFDILTSLNTGITDWPKIFNTFAAGAERIDFATMELILYCYANK